MAGTVPAGKSPVIRGKVAGKPVQEAVWPRAVMWAGVRGGRPGLEWPARASLLFRGESRPVKGVKAVLLNTKKRNPQKGRFQYE